MSNQSSLYTAVIPAQADGTTVNYYIEADDNEGFTTTEPANAPTSTYSYVVGYEAPTLYVNELMADNDTITLQEPFMSITNTSTQTDIANNLSLYDYPPISLSKMNDVALLDRTDTKYVLSKPTLQQLMPQLADDYSVLVVNTKRVNNYRTLYFDSAEFGLYRRHHAGILNRYKVRSREYVDSHLAFLEVKHKTNKGRTIKSRIKIPELTASLRGESAEFLDKTYPYNNADLEPKLWVDYSRITLVSQRRKERVTVDLNLTYRWNGQTISLPHIAIVEIKQQRSSRDSDMARQLRHYGVRPISFSKYCIGVSLLYPEQKHNNFKSKLLVVEKLAEREPYVYLH